MTDLPHNLDVPVVALADPSDKPYDSEDANATDLTCPVLYWSRGIAMFAMGFVVGAVVVFTLETGFVVFIAYKLYRSFVPASRTGEPR